MPNMNKNSFTITEHSRDPIQNLKSSGEWSPSRMDANHLPVLPLAEAEAFANYRGEVELDGLTDLSRSCAGKLGRHLGVLNLNGLKSLSDEVAFELANQMGPLRLNGVRELSTSSANAFGAHEGELSLGGLNLLTEEAATGLATNTGTLLLDGLKELAPSAAAALANHRGPLSLNGLESLSDEAVEALIQHDGALLLDSLKGLSKSAGNALARHHGRYAYYQKVTRMWGNCIEPEEIEKLTDSPRDVSLAEKWAEHDGELNLSSLESISPLAAAALARFSGELKLDGLKHLSSQTARALAAHEGGLSLNHMEDLSVQAAKELARHQGELSLNWLENLTEKAALALIEHPGKITIGDSLDGLPLALQKQFEEKAPQYHHLDWVETIQILSDSDEHRALAREAANHGGHTQIPIYLKSDIQLAREAVNHGGDNRFSSLKEISDAAVIELAKSKGELHFPALKSLSDESARILAQREILIESGALDAESMQCYLQHYLCHYVDSRPILTVADARKMIAHEASDLLITYGGIEPQAWNLLHDYWSTPWGERELGGFFYLFGQSQKQPILAWEFERLFLISLGYARMTVDFCLHGDDGLFYCNYYDQRGRLVDDDRCDSNVIGILPLIGCDYSPNDLGSVGTLSIDLKTQQVVCKDAWGDVDGRAEELLWICERNGCKRIEAGLQVSFRESDSDDDDDSEPRWSYHMRDIAIKPFDMSTDVSINVATYNHQLCTKGFRIVPMSKYDRANLLIFHLRFFIELSLDCVAYYRDSFDPLRRILKDCRLICETATKRVRFTSPSGDTVDVSEEGCVTTRKFQIPVHRLLSKARKE
jgi:hypothetical protein